MITARLYAAIRKDLADNVNWVDLDTLGRSMEEAIQKTTNDAYFSTLDKWNKANPVQRISSFALIEEISTQKEG